MLKNKKIKLIISCALILLPALLILILRDHLPADLSKAPFILLSVIMLAVHIVCIAVTEYDNRRGQSGKVMNLIYFAIPTVNAVSYGITAMAAMGHSVGIYFVFCIFMGVIFIVVGNYMPKSKRNRTIGVKIKWTLESDANWNATHRFAGKVWVIGGILFIICAWLPEKFFLPTALCAIAALAIIPLVYSYLFYRRAVKNGEYDKDAVRDKPAVSKKVKAVSAVLVCIILIGVVILMFTGNIKVSCGETSLTVEATYWSDLTLEYGDIVSISCIEDAENDFREYGFASARILLGRFRNDTLGSYTRYTYTSCDTAVIIRTADSVYMISRMDASQTKALYEELLLRTEGK